MKHFLRLDPRSLGVFRIVMGVVLLCDLLSRWRFIDEFYTNDGVSPNHNHLYNLKSEGHSLWSALHSVSGDGEATVAFALFVFFYLGFLFGFKTRAFQVLAFLSLLSLTTRNVLAENAGNLIALGLLGLTVFLPLSSRYSVDALIAGMRGATERTHQDLLQPRVADQAKVEAHRAPGWSPTSMAAFGVLLQLALLFFALSYQHTGAWLDGSALSKALHTVRIASPWGFGLRTSGILSGLTYLLHYAGFAIAILLLVPVLPGKMRGVAATLMVFTGLTYGLLFQFGLFGWTIVAAAPLVIASETWDKWETGKKPARAVTVVYDSDCGICFWLCKLVKRLDFRGAVTFVGNEALRDAESSKLPKEVTAELADKTVVVITTDKRVLTEGDAVRACLRALRSLAWLGVLLSVPGLRELTNYAYRSVATNRTTLSTDLGLTACGVTSGEGVAEYRDDLTEVVAPSQQLRHRITAGFREAASLILVATIVTSATHANKLPIKLPEVGWLQSIAWYGRFTQKWDVLVPEPAAQQGRFVVDAVVKDERNIDTFTGEAPHFGFDQPVRLGQMWSDFLNRVQSDEYKGYQQAFRTYLGKAGPRWDTKPDNNKLVGLDAYWITGPTMGGAPIEQRRFHRHARGGTNQPDKNATPGRIPPGIRPGQPMLSPPKQ